MQNYLKFLPKNELNHLKVAQVGGRIGHVLPVLTVTIIPTYISSTLASWFSIVIPLLFLSLQLG